MKATLWMTPRSPFARRVRLAAARVGLELEERLVDVFEPTEEFLAASPLGLVPVLRWAGDSVAVPDSAAILEAIHEQALARAGAAGLWPKEAALARAIRVRSAWCTGVMTAVVARFLEKKSSSPSAEVIQDHESVVERTLRVIHEDLAGATNGLWSTSGAPRSERELTQAGWDLLVALEYLDLRYPELGWREKAANCREFFAKIQTRPELDRTHPPA